MFYRIRVLKLVISNEMVAALRVRLVRFEKEHDLRAYASSKAT